MADMFSNISAVSLSLFLRVSIIWPCDYQTVLLLVGIRSHTLCLDGMLHLWEK
jgi:hypothetical protein